MFLVITLSIFISRAADSLQALEWWSLLCVFVIVLNVSIAMAIIWRQPQNTANAAFMARLTLHNLRAEFIGKIQSFSNQCLTFCTKKQFFTLIIILHFQVPFVPLIPIFSTFFNVYLMVQLGSGTWIRYAVWMALGM